jgi:hypothetical protein
MNLVRPSWVESRVSATVTVTAFSARTSPAWFEKASGFGYAFSNQSFNPARGVTMTARRLFLLLPCCLFLGFLAVAAAAAAQAPAVAQFTQPTEKPGDPGASKPPLLPPGSIYRWEDYTQPFKTRIQGISSGNPKVVLVELPEALSNSDEVELYLSTFVVGSPSFASGRVGLHVNYKPLPPFTIGPGLKLLINKGYLKSGLNGLRFDYSGMGSLEVYELRFGLPEALAHKQSPGPVAAPPRPEATPIQEPSAAPAPAAAEKPEPPARAAPAPPLSPLPGGDPGQRWAVIIGVSNYEDSRIPSLRYATRDAQVLHDWLVSPGGGRYAPSNVKLLLDKNATNEKIKDALFNWLKQAIEEDVVVIYFAGHGSPESPDAHHNLYLLPYNTRYDNIAVTGFPMWDIETALKRFIKARRVVIIADACHAAGVGQAFDIAARADRGLQINPINAGLQNLTDTGEGVCVISASRDREFSQEGREWGGGHGVFSHYLIEGLKGAADFDKSGSVTIGEITVYVSQQVRRATRNSQNPIVAGRFDPSLVIGIGK